MSEHGNIFGGIQEGEVVENPFEILEEEDDVANPFAPAKKPDALEPGENLTQFPVTKANEQTIQPDDENDGDDGDGDGGDIGDVSPLTAAVSTQEKKENASIFALPPVFEYAGAKEDITDPKMTFEELRNAKKGDFPEMDVDGQEKNRVSWSMSYGSIVKSVSAPNTTVIYALKKEIEQSKAFLDSLKKAKDKSPRCIVKPTITAQKKGTLPSYKGVFPSLTAARASDKVISLFPASDGNVYERRCSELGEFITKAGDNITDLEAVRAGFTPALPPLPSELVQQIIAFFRAVMVWNGSEAGGKDALEALVNVYWDREQQVFVLDVPAQSVRKESVNARPSDMDAGRYVHYMDVHSHNTMSANFSMQDNMDERATRVYVVMGKLHHYFPDISARISNGGKYQSIPVAQVFEPVGGTFDTAWLDKVDFSGQLLKQEVDAA